MRRSVTLYICSTFSPLVSININLAIYINLQHSNFINFYLNLTREFSEDTKVYSTRSQKIKRGVKKGMPQLL